MKRISRWCIGIGAITLVIISGIAIVTGFMNDDQIQNDSPLYQIRNGKANGHENPVEICYFPDSFDPEVDVGASASSNENPTRDPVILWTILEPWCDDLSESGIV